MKTLRNTLLLIAALITGEVSGQQNPWLEALQHYRDSLNAVFADPERSILNEDKLLFFRSLSFYPPDETWKIHARVKKLKNTSVFRMKTTKAHRNPEYQAAYRLDFKRGGRKYRLYAYSNLELRKNPEYADYLFLPFTDESSGRGSYPGGRYLDLRESAFRAKEVELDFNYCYNPYCAYNDKYACPIPPQENHLNTEVKAGAAYYQAD